MSQESRRLAGILLVIPLAVICGLVILGIRLIRK